MELLSQGAMVERFERKKMAVKNKLNELVDDLFAFMLSEVTTIAPPALHPVMATSGGATITVVPSSIIPQPVPPAPSAPAANKSSPVVPPSGSGTISASTTNNNPVIVGNGLGSTTFTMLKPVSKPAAAHVAMKVKEEILLDEEEEDEDDEEDEYDDDDEVDIDQQHNRTSISSIRQLTKASHSAQSRSQSAVSRQRQSTSSSAGQMNHSSNHSSNHRQHHHHHHNHPHHTHSHHPSSSGFCDTDDDSCECYDCMDESMVKVEMEMENDDDSDDDNMGKHFYATSSEEPKRKRQRTFAERRTLAGGSSGGGDLDGVGGPSDAIENVDDDEESESVSNNHQIDTLGLKCWFKDCNAMLEDRQKLNQHLYFEHEKTLPYQCRVIGCGRQFDVR